MLPQLQRQEKENRKTQNGAGNEEITEKAFTEQWCVGSQFDILSQNLNKIY